MTSSMPALRERRCLARIRHPALYLFGRARQTVGQEAGAGLGDQHLVLDAHAEAAVGQVDAGYDGQDHAGLERLLAIYESDLARATELLQERRAAFATGKASAVDLDEAALLRQGAEDNVLEVRAWIDQADRLEREARLSDNISRQPAPQRR